MGDELSFFRSSVTYYQCLCQPQPPCHQCLCQPQPPCHQCLCQPQPPCQPWCQPPLPCQPPQPYANACWFPTIEPVANNSAAAAIAAMLKVMVVFDFIIYTLLLRL